MTAAGDVGTASGDAGAIAAANGLTAASDNTGSAIQHVEAGDIATGSTEAITGLTEFHETTSAANTQPAGT